MRSMATALVVVGLLAGSVNLATADVFNMGNGLTNLEFVTVGDPGNAADTLVMGDGTSGYGAVSYTYQMGTYEVTAGQYCRFLNAVASTQDTYGLYNSDMWESPYGCKITRAGAQGGYFYNVERSLWANRPVNFASWGDAARFANWLSNGQPTGPEGPGTTETGSYTLNGATNNAALRAVSRNSDATYVVPSEDEWYKAAYYKGESTNAGYWKYPTHSDSTPNNVLSAMGTNNANFFDGWGIGNGNGSYTIGEPYYRTPVGAFAGSASPYGTFDQGGNVWEWNETWLPSGGFLGVRGGSWSDNQVSLPASDRNYIHGPNSYPPIEGYDVGFRIAMVPEPATLSLLALGGLLLARRRSA